MLGFSRRSGEKVDPSVTVGCNPLGISASILAALYQEVLSGHDDKVLCNASQKMCIAFQNTNPADVWL